MDNVIRLHDTAERDATAVDWLGDADRLLRHLQRTDADPVTLYEHLGNARVLLACALADLRVRRA